MAVNWFGAGATGLSVGASLLGGFSSLSGGDKAKKDAKRLARKNKKYIKKEATEDQRRAERQEDIRRGASRARAYASGVRMSGSLSDWETAQQQEFENQMDWLRESARSRVKIAKKGGGIAASQAQQQGQLGFIGALGSIASVLGQQWWR